MKKVPSDLMDRLAGKPQDKGRTEEVQETDKRPMKKYQIRMDERDWIAIKRYCDSRRLSVSAFIRIATKEYMEREGI